MLETRPFFKGSLQFWKRKTVAGCDFLNMGSKAPITVLRFGRIFRVVSRIELVGWTPYLAVDLVARIFMHCAGEIE